MAAVDPNLRVNTTINSGLIVGISVKGSTIILQKQMFSKLDPESLIFRGKNKSDYIKLVISSLKVKNQATMLETIFVTHVSNK